MIDLRCSRCLAPLASHTPFSRMCHDGETGGPFVLMDGERARELLVERARNRAPAEDGGSHRKETEQSALSS